MNTWHLATYAETWALLRAGIEHAFSVDNGADPQRPSFHELSRVVREVVQVRRWEKALYESLRDELQARADACVSQCSDVTTVAAAWRAFSSSLGTVATVFRSLDAALRVGLDSIYCVGTTCLRRSLAQRGLYEPLVKELVQMVRARLDDQTEADCRA